MGQITTYQYHNCPIEFQILGGHVYANATAMCKAFNKLPNEFLRSASAAQYIEVIAEKFRISESQVVMTRQGAPGTGGGTWIHERLVIKLAQWLDVQFEFWCNDCIAELLRTGSVSIRPNEVSRKELALMVLQAEQENEILKTQLDQTTILAAKNLHKAAYVDQVLQSDGTWLTTTIAKELGMSAIALNKVLAGKKIQYKRDDHWVLYADYQNEGYTTTHTYSFRHTNGESGTAIETRWTERGRAFIHYIDNGGLQHRRKEIDKVLEELKSAKTINQHTYAD